MTQQLGLPGYIVHGGDWGGYMASLAGLDHAASVRGVHTTYVALRTADAPLQGGGVPTDASVAEKAYAAHEKALHAAEGAYGEVQSTRPLALAPAMLDSPVGVAAWMVDKFHAWSDRRTTAFDVLFPFDRLLTEIMLYLVSDTVETATWIYSASRAEGLVTLPPGRRVEVPTAVAAFPDPAFPVPPRELVARSHDVIRYTPMARGGHFPFYEAPDLLIDDLRAFARTLT